MTKLSWYARCTACIEWAKANGVKGLFSGRKLAPGIGYLLYTSGAGPTRDGRIKPEVVAPGAEIATAKVANAPFPVKSVQTPTGDVVTGPTPDDPDDFHRVWAGTSFAAPHVGGVVALMLQMNPYLSPNEITSLLKADARQDNFTGPIDKSTGSALWGWGKIDALSSTLDAPNLYSIRIGVAAVDQPLSAEVTLDGTLVESIPLNKTNTITLEFSRGGSHTVELTPIIDVEPGTRYVLFGTPWTFSSGGTLDIAYHEQYYLQVNSQYGYANGTAWYDANSAATASITPTSIDGHQFQGWTGAIVSSSPTVTVKMDSSKEISATWSESSVSGIFVPLALLAEGIVILAVVIAIIAFVKLRKRRVRFHPGLSAT